MTKVEQMDAAVAQLLDGDFPTDWVIIIEAIAKDGEPYLLHMVSEDITSWKLQGMLNHTVGIADILLDAADPEDDES